MLNGLPASVGGSSRVQGPGRERDSTICSWDLEGRRATTGGSAPSYFSPWIGIPPGPPLSWPPRLGRVRYSQGATLQTGDPPLCFRSISLLGLGSLEILAHSCAPPLRGLVRGRLAPCVAQHRGRLTLEVTGVKGLPCCVECWNPTSCAGGPAL